MENYTIQNIDNESELSCEEFTDDDLRNIDLLQSKLINKIGITDGIIVEDDSNSDREESEESNEENKDYIKKTIPINTCSLNDDLHIIDLLQSKLINKIGITDGIIIGDDSNSDREESLEESDEENEEDYIKKTIPINTRSLKCKSCHNDYQWFCSKCSMLTHILNKNVQDNYDDRPGRTLPNNFLKIMQTDESFGVFALTDIPRGIKFGPYEGLTPYIDKSEVLWNIKGGKLVDGNNGKSTNWMKFINTTQTNSKQNLSFFQYEDSIYYRSTKNIKEGEELLVYFNKRQLEKNKKMSFQPATEKEIENVFGCTFCCVGYSSEEYLRQHKTVCSHILNDSIEEVVQCAFCKIYIEEKEYSDFHMSYCCSKNSRKAILPSAQRTSKIRIHIHGKQPKLYKCPTCPFMTKYETSLTRHGFIHSSVKKFNCDKCVFSTNEKRHLFGHVRNEHYPTLKKHFQCKSCTYATNVYVNFHYHVNKHHPQQIVRKYKCENCSYVGRSHKNLLKHRKFKHGPRRHYKCLKESSYVMTIS